MDTRILIEHAQDALAELQDDLQLTVALATFSADGQRGVVVYSHGGGKVFNFTPMIGYVFPLHASGPGKALLSALPSGRLQEIVGRIELTGYTDTTITQTPDLLHELRKDHERGFSIDNGELVVGINCVSAPVLGADGFPIAAVWLTAPSVDLPERAFDRLGKKVRAAAARIEARLRGDRDTPDKYTLQVIRKAQERMGEDLSSHMDMAGLAEALGVGYEWFRKQFKQKTGESPTRYHTRLRIEKAQKLLTLTEQSVKEIALQLGYRSQDYFSAIFKKKTGLSPSQFREER